MTPRPPPPPPPPPSAGVFAGRLEALRSRSATELRPGPAEAELDAFRTLAERLAGPAAVAQIPRLEPLLRELQTRITGRRAQAERLPVKALGTAEILRSEVRVLRVRVAGGNRAVADRWAATLRAALTSEPVLVPAEG